MMYLLAGMLLLITISPHDITIIKEGDTEVTVLMRYQFVSKQTLNNNVSLFTDINFAMFFYNKMCLLLQLKTQ